MTFYDFLKIRLIESDQYDDEYWKQRMAQFQAAQQGEKDVIKSDQGKVADYKAQRQPVQQNQPQGKVFVKMSDGEYEQMTSEDEKNGLTTLSRWTNPAKDGSYYRKMGDGKFHIIRPRINKLFK